MEWAKKNWRLVILNGVALVIVLRLIPGFFDPADLHPVFNASFEASGLWAIRFLLLSLAMSPANTYLGWRSVIPLRKSAGLWAFGFAVMHAAFHLLTNPQELQVFFNQEHLVLGLIAITILSLLAVTSHRWAMKWMGKTWKRLHRLVYVAGAAVALHALIAYTTSKKAFVLPEMKVELGIYLALMIFLLAIRLPVVKRAGRFIQGKGARRRTVTAQ